VELSAAAAGHQRHATTPVDLESDGRPAAGCLGTLTGPLTEEMPSTGSAL